MPAGCKYSPHPPLRMSLAYRRLLRRERTTASATAGCLRILEDEPAPHQVFLIVERRLVEVKVALRVHKKPCSVLFDDFIAVPRLCLQTHRVRQSRAPATLHTDAQPARF